MTDFSFVWRRNVVTDIVQGIIVGGVLAFLTFQILTNASGTTVNGWTTISGCGEPGNGLILQAARADIKTILQDLKSLDTSTSVSGSATANQ